MFFLASTVHVRCTVVASPLHISLSAILVSCDVAVISVVFDQCSSHLCLGRPLGLFPFRPPLKIVFASPSDLQM